MLKEGLRNAKQLDINEFVSDSVMHSWKAGLESRGQVMILVMESTNVKCCCVFML